jgi:hypothetical protein
MLAEPTIVSLTLAQPRRTTPGDGDKARQLLTEPIAIYRQIGMPKHVDMAEVMLGEPRPPD